MIMLTTVMLTILHTTQFKVGSLLRSILQVVEAPNSFSNLLDDEIRTVPLANLTPIHYDDQDKTDEHVRAEAEGDVANVPCLSAAEETAIAVALDHFRYRFTMTRWSPRPKHLYKSAHTASCTSK